MMLQPDLARNFRNVDEIEKQALLLAAQLKDAELEKMSAKETLDCAMTFNEKSDYVNAEKFFSLALEKVVHETDQSTKDYITAGCWYGLANVARELGKNSEACSLFMRARFYMEGVTVTAQTVTLKYDIERNLGIAYTNLNDFRSAAQCFEAAMTLALRFEKNSLVPAVKSYYGWSLVKMGLEHGLTDLQAAAELFPLEVREKSMDWAAHKNREGDAFKTLGKYEESILSYKEALRLRIKLIDRNKIGDVYFHSRLGDTTLGLGECYLRLHLLDEAKTYLTDAAEHFRALGNESKLAKSEELLLAIAQITPENSSALPSCAR